MLETVASGFWLSFLAYTLWYMFRAKEFRPLTLDDLALLWRIHKHQTGCRASRLHDLLVKNDEEAPFHLMFRLQELSRTLAEKKP